MKNVLLPSLLLLLIVSVVNGSRKPLLLISMDGMRSSAFEDFLKENPDSTFHKRLINTGLKADYVTPIFPSLTFPNHWSIVTGGSKFSNFLNISFMKLTIFNIKEFMLNNMVNWEWVFKRMI